MDPESYCDECLLVSPVADAHYRTCPRYNGRDPHTHTFLADAAIYGKTITAGHITTTTITVPTTTPLWPPTATTGRTLRP